MQSAIDGNVIVARVDDGEDLFEAITSAMDAHGAKSAVVLTGIGMLDDFELGYFNGSDYRNEFFAKPKELVGLHGNVTTADRKVIHLHAAVAGEDHKVIGGHLHRASVCVVCELTMLKIDGFEMTRKHDPKTGLKLLKLG
ncbi:MAG: PPC domain-containing DNA-binding protein [Methanobacteriota archaeon]